MCPAATEPHQQFRRYETALIGLGAIPAVAVGRRVRTGNGNILSDCIATRRDVTVTLIGERVR